MQRERRSEASYLQDPEGYDEATAPLGEVTGIVRMATVTSAYPDPAYRGARVEVLEGNQGWQLDGGWIPVRMAGDEFCVQPEEITYDEEGQ